MVIPPDYGKKRLNRLTISAHGLSKCQKILEALAVATDEDVVFEAALSFAVILYARPFSDNEVDPEAKSVPRVKEKDITKELNPREMELHRKLLELRNKALAHAEWVSHPTKIDGKGIISTMPFSILAELQGDRISKFSKLVEKVLPLVELQRASWWSYVQMNEL